MKESRDKLGRIEIWSYTCIWTCACFYAIYHVYLSTDSYFADYDDAYNDFKSGWSFLNRKSDNSDEEWKFWIPLVYKLIPWIFTQVVVGQYLKKLSYNTEILCGWYISVSIAFLWYYYGSLSTLCMLFLPFLSCLITSYRSKSLSWFFHASTLVIIYYANSAELVFKEWLYINDENYYMFVSALSWTQLRSLSYSIDSIEIYKQKNFNFFNNFIQNIAYCLYLPTLFLGPVILYKQFTDSIEKPFSQWNKDKISKLFLNLFRYTFWMVFTDFSMHYVYFNAIRFHPLVVKNLGSWAFYGVGYCMGQYFLNKYVVIYGFTSTISRTEDIDAPPQPKCISRIYLYSDMWKHFDRGLYKFLLRYIYIPCYNPKTPFRKLYSSALTFVFIYLWHGMHFFVFIWAFLNFLGIVIESLVRTNSEYFYKKILYKLSPQNQQRIECALASPLLVLSALSSFYFFAGEEIGNIYVARVFEESWSTLFTLLFILYCCCQTSKEVKRREERSMMNGKDNKIKIR